ncbi:MAG: TetR family transcriptional regulator [Flavipsychrobacter sp.]
MARVKTFDREEVLHKAMHLFWVKGYNATSMQDLVDTLGINRSSMYDTFGDKRQLFLTALRTYHTNANRPLLEMIQQTEDVEELLNKIFGTTVQECSSKDGSKGCFVANSAVELAPHDEEVAAIVQENMDDLENALTKRFTKAQADGTISKQQTPRSLARFVMNTLTGLRIAAKSGAGRKKYTDVVNVAMTLLK